MFFEGTYLDNNTFIVAYLYKFLLLLKKEKLMGKFIDLTGQKFGRLLVLERAENKYGRTAWKCKCDCGN